MTGGSNFAEVPQQKVAAFYSDLLRELIEKTNAKKNNGISVVPMANSDIFVRFLDFQTLFWIKKNL